MGNAAPNADNAAKTAMAIGFPPPQLGATPVRLNVLACAPGILALEKPAGIRWETANTTNTANAKNSETNGSSIVAALRAQLDAQKPELAPFALERPASVWDIETEIYGIGLLVSRGELLERWRNALGSDQLVFHYEILAPANAARPPRLECTLPVALHHNGNRAVISHETGRKSRTVFERRETCGKWEWWVATCRYPRFHQIRIHAAEVGLNIAGENLYFAGSPSKTAKSPALATPVPVPRIEDFLRRGRLNKGEAETLILPPALRLARVSFPKILTPAENFPPSAKTNSAENFPAGIAVIQSPLPRKWAALRKRLNSH